MSYKEIEKYTFETLDKYQSIYEQGILNNKLIETKTILTERLENHERIFKNLQPKEIFCAKSFVQNALANAQFNDIYEKRFYETAFKYMPKIEIDLNCDLNIGRLFGIMNVYFERGQRIERLKHLISQLDNKIAFTATSQENIPAYKIHLFEKALLYNDYKRVVKGLDDVAIDLIDFLNKDVSGPKKETKFTWQFLQENFLQVNGKEFSKKTCEHALNLANTKPAKDPLDTHKTPTKPPSKKI